MKVLLAASLVGAWLALVAPAAAGAVAPKQPVVGQLQPLNAAIVRAPPAPLTADGIERPSAGAPLPALRPDQIALLEKALSEAGAEGLERGFLTPALRSMLGSTDPGVRLNGEIELVSATLDYARAVHSGRLVPSEFLYDWALRPAAYDPTVDFEHALAQDRLAGWLKGLPPQYGGYEALRRALATYRAIAADGGWSVISPGPVLTVGAAGPRVRALWARLAVEDRTISATGAIFDQSLAAAVMRAQRRFGLPPSGVLDKPTLSALNVPAEQRIAQIEANMERWRWLPPALPPDRIELNIGRAVVTVFQDAAPVLSMRAITGRPSDPTPILESEVGSIVLNPPWDVPDDIAAKELWPKERADPGYFARRHFIVVQEGNGETRLQQKAGPNSALGKILFELPNSYGVYLHDTPARGLFDQTRRLDSHGCVRLEEPLKLANLVMAGDARWTPEAINKTIAGGETVRLNAARPTAVFLLYWTAEVDASGQANFHNDPYGWDAILTQRLETVDNSPASRDRELSENVRQSSAGK